MVIKRKNLKIFPEKFNSVWYKLVGICLQNDNEKCLLLGGLKDHTKAVRLPVCSGIKLFRLTKLKNCLKTVKNVIASPLKFQGFNSNFISQKNLNKIV